MVYKRCLILIQIIILFSTFNCTSSQDSDNAEDITILEPVTIIDRAGREWDVTHAYHVYGMDPEFFNFGLGIGVINSVDEPEVLVNGDPAYPDPSWDEEIFGVDYNGEQRAYSVTEISSHEVFNEIYPGQTNTHVAVTF